MPQVFDEVPEVGYSYTDELPVSIRRDGGPFEAVGVGFVVRLRRRGTEVERCARPVYLHHPRLSRCRQLLR